MVLAAALGGVGALGQAPYDLPIFTLGMLWGAFAVLRLAGPRARQAAALGWALGLGYFAHALIWIVHPFLVEPDRFGWLAPLAILGMAGGLGLFWAGAFALVRWLRGGRLGWGR